jgi:hypothetical protein
MLRKKSFYMTIVVAGICLFGGSILLNFLFVAPKLVSGLGVGIGAALIGVGLPKLIMKRCETAQPEMMKLNQIELNDERNTMIRDKSKAKTADIIQWVIMGLGYIAIVIEAPQWVIFAAVGVYLLKNILEMIFNIRYQKEL